ncbi:MAG: hypothetical protein AMXMBFR64_39540 [Myxococcales bacterium]
MTDETRINIPHSPSSFPMAELVEAGVWAQIPSAAKAVLAVIWNYHRRFPDSCHPSRSTIATEAGVHESTVSRSLDDLEEMGVVQVVPQPGPHPNHYQVCWTNIHLKKAKTPERKSPYPMPHRTFDTALEQDEGGRDVTKFTRRDAAHHVMADGCIVRSAVETVIHEHLVTWKVPHWTDVPYATMGIKLKNPKTGEMDRTSTVDFVVAPYYLLERKGLVGYQPGAEKYKSKLKAKLKAISDSRWDGWVLDPDTRPGDWMLAKILPRWSNATIAEAKALRDQMRAAGKFTEAHQPSRWLDEMIASAEARLSGQRPPCKARGLSVMESDEHGFPVERRTTPRLVLMEAAGTAPASPAPAVEPPTSAKAPPQSSRTKSLAEEVDEMQAALDAFLAE